MPRCGLWAPSAAPGLPSGGVAYGIAGGPPAGCADAQSQEVRALADYQIAQVDLAFATGTLLRHDRIR